MWGPGTMDLETGREFPAGIHQQGWSGGKGCSVWEKEEVNLVRRQGHVTPLVVWRCWGPQGEPAPSLGTQSPHLQGCQTGTGCDPNAHRGRYSVMSGLVLWVPAVTAKRLRAWGAGGARG